MMVKMKSMFAIGFAFTSLLSMFNSIFDGRVVAKLPFTPITWFQVRAGISDFAIGKSPLVSFSDHIVFSSQFRLFSEKNNLVSSIKSTDLFIGFV